MTNDVYELCLLIDKLISDIKHLESEVVRTRLKLSKYLEHPYDELLRLDILSDLGGRYAKDPAYEAYINLLYNGQDPMDSDEWISHITSLAQESDDM